MAGGLVEDPVDGQRTVLWMRERNRPFDLHQRVVEGGVHPRLPEGFPRMFQKLTLLFRIPELRRKILLTLALNGCLRLFG